VPGCRENRREAHRTIPTDAPNDVVELLGKDGDGLTAEQWNTIEASIQEGLHFRNVEGEP
jgi:hypothetical protein